MIKKTITYVDFNGKERTEDFYFHLSLPEATRIVAEFGARDTDQLSDIMERMIEKQDFKSILDVFDRIVLSSYGKKSVDGRSFVKTEADREAFENSEAYATLFEEIVNNPEGAMAFFEGIGATVKKTGQNGSQPLIKPLA